MTGGTGRSSGEAAILVRPVEPSDFTDWLPLWDGYNAFYGRAGPTALPRAVTDVTWARFHDPDEPVHGLVATARSGELIGLAHYLFHRSTTAIVPSCYLQDLFTTEAARGRGVGRALIETVYRAADVGGASRVYWHTHETNAVAMRLYDVIGERSGFVVYRRPPAA